MHVTDHLQNASLNLPLFLPSRHFYSCSLLFPLIWSRCRSCWKMEVCVFYEREARRSLGLPGESAGLQGCRRGLRVQLPREKGFAGLERPRVYRLTPKTWVERRWLRRKKMPLLLEGDRLGEANLRSPSPSLAEGLFQVHAPLTLGDILAFRLTHG